MAFANTPIKADDERQLMKSWGPWFAMTLVAKMLKSTLTCEMNWNAAVSGLVRMICSLPPSRCDAN